jgi:hypothetical protein
LAPAPIASAGVTVDQPAGTALTVGVAWAVNWVTSTSPSLTPAGLPTVTAVTSAVLTACDEAPTVMVPPVGFGVVPEAVIVCVDAALEPEALVATRETV